MAHKRDHQNNSFGRRLERLLLDSNVKNATIAQALNYDVSYISKWITGTAVPSRKNVEKILGEISRLVVEQSPAQNRETMLRGFGVRDESTLRTAVADTLRDAYYETVGELNERQYVNNAALRVSPAGQFPLLEDYAAALEGNKPQHIAVAVDLFSLEHLSKLRMAGIEESRFRLKERRPDLHMDYVIDLSALDGTSVYDVILLIHMMTCFSQADFRLYDSDWVRGKLLITAQNAFAGVTLLGRDRQFMCTTTTRDKGIVGELYDQVERQADPDRLVFLPVEMESLLRHHEYFHNLLSPNKRWLVGHMTEQFLSPALFERLSRRCFGAEPELAAEADRAYLLTGAMLRERRVKVLLYDSALVDFVLSGELDFFNRKLILTPEERKEEMEYLRALAQEGAAESIRLVKEGFSDDFKYITNPCVFLSESVSYLRLENRRYENNLLLVKHESAKKIFDAFFEKSWDYDRRVVLSGETELLEKLDDLIRTAELLAENGGLDKKNQ